MLKKIGYLFTVLLKDLIEVFLYDERPYLLFLLFYLFLLQSHSVRHISDHYYEFDFPINFHLILL